MIYIEIGWHLVKEKVQSQEIITLFTSSNDYFVWLID